jgi:hypothetical protein
MNGPRASKLALAAASVALLGGCSSTQVVGADRTLRVSLSEYRITPPSVRVHAGELTILAHNDGRVMHNLVISRDGVVAGATRSVWPGATAEVTITLTAGRYTMASTILSDQALGEYGNLQVTP